MDDKTTRRISPFRRENWRPRSLRVETLESRVCPAGFSFSGFAGGVLTFDGTSGNDELTAIWGNLATGTIWWQSNSGALGGYVDTDTEVAIPTVASPIEIAINGLGGDDTVTFWLGPQGAANMGGFPTGASAAVSLISFSGGDGIDLLLPPQGSGTATPTAGAVILPTDENPNIRFYGGPGDDTLYNFNDPEFFSGNAGRDTVSLLNGPGWGNDILFGDGDMDTLYGGKGDDKIYGGDLRDWLFGDDGTDWIEGGLGGDAIHGGNHDDFLFGGDGGDDVDGQGGDDYIEGNNGNDTLLGGPDWDTILTGPSDITDFRTEINGVLYNDVVYGEDDNDLIYALDAGAPVYLVGGGGEDIITGSETADYIDGSSGNDSLNGADGNDTIDTGASGAVATLDYSGGPGEDYFEVVYGYGGIDTIDASSAGGAVFVDGGEEDDTIYGSAFDDALGGGGGHDTIHGHGGNDGIDGGDGNDVLYGDAGQDYVAGNYGADTIFGGAGTDNLSGYLGSIAFDGAIDLIFGADGTTDGEADFAICSLEEGDSFDGVEGLDYLNGYLM